MADVGTGMYKHTGSDFIRQDSGFILGASDRREIEVYNFDSNNSPYKIYPRQIAISIGNSAVGGYWLSTLRSGYEGTFDRSRWRINTAYQGFFRGAAGLSDQHWGHFFANNGGKISVPRNISKC